MSRFLYIMATLATLTIFSLCTVTAVPAALAAEAIPQLKDVSTSWAAEHINALTAKGIIKGYPDGYFRPENTISRAEFARIVAKAFSLPKGDEQPFSDMNGHWAAEDVAALHAAGLLEDYIQGAFQPALPISRAEVTAIIIRALKLEDVAAVQNMTSTEFTDVPSTHWAAPAIKAADRLDILPAYFEGQFKPSTAATRAEVAAIVNGALRLQIVRGVVDYVDADQFHLSIMTDDGTLRDFSVPPTATIYRNVGGVEQNDIRVGDDIYVAADRYGTPIFVKANGLITQDDVANKVSGITKGLLTPEQLKAAIRGDWTAVAEGFQVTLYNQLLDLGSTPLEADAIMQKDWATLQSLGRERLASALSNLLNMSEELVTALMDRDWATAGELAKTEATQYLLSMLIFGMDN
ncbi:MAG TPA: S-layer homology domain-containing protein [Firmicutes bacterium]|nr:S-layer homology domain-containing protein [Bacillota bacterium]